jgi:hypothetical protein
MQTPLKEVISNFLEYIQFHKIPANVLMREVHPLGLGTTTSLIIILLGNLLEYYFIIFHTHSSLLHHHECTCLSS